LAETSHAAIDQIKASYRKKPRSSSSVTGVYGKLKARMFDGLLKWVRV